AYVALGEILERKGCRKAAIAVYRQLIRQDPKNYHGHCKLGLAYRSTQEWGKAIASLQEATRLSPNYSEAPRQLAWLLVTCPDLPLRDPAGALAAAGKAVKSAPTDGGSWLALGMACYRLRDWDGAIVDLTKADKLTVTKAYPWIFLAMAHW